MDDPSQWPAFKTQSPHESYYQTYCKNCDRRTITNDINNYLGLRVCYAASHHRPTRDMLEECARMRALMQQLSR